METPSKEPLFKPNKTELSPGSVADLMRKGLAQKLKLFTESCREKAENLGLSPYASFGEIYTEEVRQAEQERREMAEARGLPEDSTIGQIRAFDTGTTLIREADAPKGLRRGRLAVIGTVVGGKIDLSLESMAVEDRLLK